ncbi:MAG: hypothetical protein GXO39_01245 [Thermotogae bacterium]|nr:hypothetical protein [Thermotogota bacterium]
MFRSIFLIFSLFILGGFICERLQPEPYCNCTGCLVVDRYAINRGEYLQATWCSSDGDGVVTDTFKTVSEKIVISYERCDANILSAPVRYDTTVCITSGCKNVIGFHQNNTIHFYSEDDSLPAGGYYIKVVKIDTLVYLIGMDVKGYRTHISPDLYDNLAPDTGNYADTVLAIIPTDTSYGHAVWMDAGSEDIDTASYGSGDFFTKVRVLEVRGDSALLRVGYRMEVPGLRWIKGG